MHLKKEVLFSLNMQCSTILLSNSQFSTQGFKKKRLTLIKDSSNMDGTLPTDFAKSEIMRDNKMLCKGLLNNLKKDIDFQN